MFKHIRHLIVNGFAASGFCRRNHRCSIYRLWGVKTETNSINSGCFFKNNEVEIGENSFINDKCYFEGPVKIGKHCAIAQEVMMITTTHEIGTTSQRSGPLERKPIKINDGAWIGARATILPGVTIGQGCVIAAGAVVTSDCEPNGLYGGVPAKLIRILD